MAKPAFYSILVFSLLNVSFMTGDKPAFYPALQTYCEALPQSFSTISGERKEALREIGDFAVAQLKAGQPANLTYICTHNSRRSQFGQAWAKVAAAYYGFGNRVFTFSGGTEATAFHKNAIEALRRAGLSIEPRKFFSKTNQEQEASYSDNSPHLVLFSKKYSSESNPQKNFCAVMVCSQADEACPLVHGASARVSLPCEDPKNADGKPDETQAYDKTCRLIALETFYVFDYVKLKLNE